MLKLKELEHDPEQRVAAFREPCTGLTRGIVLNIRDWTTAIEPNLIAFLV